MENLAEKGNKQKGDVKLAERGIGKLREKKKKAEKEAESQYVLKASLVFPFAECFISFVS